MTSEIGIAYNGERWRASVAGAERAWRLQPSALKEPSASEQQQALLRLLRGECGEAPGAVPAKVLEFLWHETQVGASFALRAPD